MMATSGGWRDVRLGEILTYLDERVDLDDMTEYITITVRRRHEGLAAREKLYGHQIKTKKQFRLVPGAFIISRIQCWHEAYALVPDDPPPNMIASSNYDQFAISPQVDRRFFWWLSHSPAFTETVRSSAAGVVIEKMVFKREEWLQKSLRLPPLGEQRRIVARIDELAAKLEDVRTLRREASNVPDQLQAAEEMRIWPEEILHTAPCLRDVTVFLTRGRQSKQGVSDHYLIKTQHVQMGQYVKSTLTLAQDVAAKVRPEAMLREGDVLIACSAAGCLGRVAYYADSDQLASTDTHVAIARADPSKIIPEYLYAYLKGAQGQVQLRSRERGDWTREKVGFRLTELNLADLRRVPVPVPPLVEQRRTVDKLNEWQATVDRLKDLQADTAAKLDAMLPSVLGRAFEGEL